MIFDLHVHTTCSDGLLTPHQVIDLAITKKLDGIAITDHDTVDAIESAIQYSKTKIKLYIIPGIEFSCIFKDEEVHILGYFIDYKSLKLKKITDSLKNKRILRGIEMVKKINKLGMNISIEEVQIEAGRNNYIGRPHIARVLVKHGFVNNIDEAFELYLNRGKEAYVEKESLKLEETIDLIHELEGIAVLAHPGLLNNFNIITSCVNLGIDGIEAVHSRHKSEDVKKLIDIAKQHNLIVTGGSDCHGILINGEYLLGNYYVNIDYIPIMKGRI
ncbi:hypothetical protein EDD65_105198 [Keratinibaculum paraultunense]|uniref:Polymerase/histidinol phosphatase N-terminal domain-containing protein n=1 Tax=Keratinibaculum paraultunense TaxID=1278232 RepID=A0A4R3L028_9FIRM|nr:PHP domain-containing protein [Keratinibaculum paraultunense]QQY80674.1 PHP domain-containing protein [Keratinibaculum paraultunense]TCS89724.1 hypothetical protein EDD65_105198 [Keratinibaculum paraultunense]